MRCFPFFWFNQVLARAKIELESHDGGVRNVHKQTFGAAFQLIFFLCMFHNLSLFVLTGFIFSLAFGLVSFFSLLVGGIFFAASRGFFGFEIGRFKFLIGLADLIAVAY